MDRKIIDASALLAYLFDETGSNMVADALEADSVLISSVNYSEVVGKLLDRNMGDEAIRSAMDALDLDVVPYDETQAMLTGLLRKNCRSYGLSLGDRACFALAMIEACPVFTADKIWKKVPIDINILLIR